MNRDRTRQGTFILTKEPIFTVWEQHCIIWLCGQKVGDYRERINAEYLAQFTGDSFAQVIERALRIDPPSVISLRMTCSGHWKIFRKRTDVI